MARMLALLLFCAFVLLAATPLAAARWTPAFATFYGGGDASGADDGERVRSMNNAG
jgi:hypothetical protein